MSGWLRIRGGTVVTLDDAGTVIDPGEVAIEGGAIAAVGRAGTLPPPERDEGVLDARRALILPGLVAAHVHSPDSLARGHLPPLPLEMWSFYNDAARWGRTPRETYLSAALCAMELLESGATAMLDHLRLSPRADLEAVEAATQAYETMGIRAVVAPVVADRPVAETLPLDRPLPDEVKTQLTAPPSASVEEQLALCREFFRRWTGRSSRISCQIGPSGPQRCTDDLLAACGDLARSLDIGFHTHFLETKAQAVVCRRLYGESAARHLMRLGALGPRAALVHSIWLEDEDVDAIGEAGATVVHCPASNLRLGSGVMPWRKIAARGIPLALGPDGCGCNDSLTPFATMKLAATLHTLGMPPEAWPKPGEVLRAATRGGARVLRLEGRVGMIAPGYRADLMVLRADQPALTPLTDPHAQLVYASEGRGVDTVIVDGRVVVRSGRVCTVDRQALLDEAAEAGRVFLARNAERFALARRIAAAVAAALAGDAWAFR